MHSCKIKSIIAVITGFSILMLFCGSIFACVLPGMNEDTGMTTRCTSNKGEKGDENQNVCTSTEFARSQNNIKLPQDIKEIKAFTSINQDQILYSDQTGFMQVYTSLTGQMHIPIKLEIFMKDRNLRI